MTWTRFMDMHSGGGLKLPPYTSIYIEADGAAAVAIFLARFGRNPRNVSCSCCDEDYFVSSEETLTEATASMRGCLIVPSTYDVGVDGWIHPGGPAYREEPGMWGEPYLTLDEYVALPDVLVIRAGAILPHEHVESRKW